MVVARFETAQRAVFDRRTVGAGQKSLQDRRGAGMLPRIDRRQRAQDQNRDRDERDRFPRFPPPVNFVQRAVSLLEDDRSWPLTIS